MRLVELQSPPALAGIRAALVAEAGPWIDADALAAAALATAEALSEQGPPSPALLRRVARDLASEVLCRAALTGEAAALERLLDLWQGDVLRWCRMMGRPGAAPEDAAADTLMAVVTDLRRINDPGRFRAWLWGVTWRTVRGHHRRAFLRRWVPGLSPDRPDPGGDAGHRYERAERGAQVQAILAGMRPEHRELLWLSYAEGLSRAELAVQLQMPAGTLNRKLHQARAAFEAAARRQGLAPPGEGAEDPMGRGGEP